MVSVRKRNIQDRYNSLRHLQRWYLNRIEYISGTKFIIITIFYNVYSKYNIPRKGQGLSGPDQPEILVCETPAKLADNPFPVKFIVIHNKSAVSKLVKCCKCRVLTEDASELSRSSEKVISDISIHLTNQNAAKCK